MLMKHLAEQISMGKMEELQAIERKQGRSCWWRYLGPGLAAVDVLAAQEEPSSPQVFYLQVKVHTIGVFFVFGTWRGDGEDWTVPAVGLAEGALGGGGFFGLCRRTDKQSGAFSSTGNIFSFISFLKTSQQTRGTHLLFHFKELHKIVREDALPSADLTHPPAGVRALLQAHTVKDFSLSNRWISPRQTERRVAQRRWPWWGCWWFRPLWS